MASYYGEDYATANRLGADPAKFYVEPKNAGAQLRVLYDKFTITEAWIAADDDIRFGGRTMNEGARIIDAWMCVEVFTNAGVNLNGRVVSTGATRRWLKTFDFGSIAGDGFARYGDPGAGSPEYTEFIDEIVGPAFQDHIVDKQSGTIDAADEGNQLSACVFYTWE